MSVRSLVIVLIGVIAFVIIDEVVTSIITGTDTGSVLIQNLLRLIVAAVILIAAIMGVGRSK